MKQIVINYLEHIEAVVVQQLGMATTGGHHADAAQTHDAVHSDAIALRARELHAVADTLTDMLALVRVVRTNLLAELEHAAPSLTDEDVRAKLGDVRDALLTVRHLGTVFPKDLVTHRFGEMVDLRAWTAPALARLESLGVPLPADAPSEAKLRMETGTARLQPEAGVSDHTDRSDRADGAAPAATPQPVTLTVEQACELRGLLRRARTWVDHVPGLDGHTRIEGHELSASLQAAADEVDSAIESVSPTTPGE